MPRIKICRLKQNEVSSGPRKLQISCGILSTALFLTITRYPLKVRKVSQYPFCLSLCKRSLILRMELVFSEKTSFMNQKFCSFSCDEKGAKAEPRACYTQKHEHTHMQRLHRRFLSNKPACWISSRSFNSCSPTDLYTASELLTTPSSMFDSTFYDSLSIHGSHS